MKKTIRIIITVLLIVLLFLVRAFEEQLFYDPLNSYFQNDYLYKKIPSLDRWNLLLHLFYRYIINSLISLAIIHLVFRNKKIIKFSQLFFTISFLVLIVAFFFSLRNNLEGGYIFTFYIRRFLIQPLFLLILLPAFYYHKKL
ncbi:MAG: exosortase F system-associated protein [Gammaproteobacteria bacterium]|nr:exosortase F system-associated protein [Gammaproteobacteria bacterium]MDG2275639.1 exosortase F system-associated protein [Flavobacteriaceae bacterium]